MSDVKLLKLFESSGALLKGHFVLTSGRHSNVYYEKFTLLKHPKICTEICKKIAEHFKGQDIETVVGPTTGGVLIAYDVARYLGIEAIYAEYKEQEDQIRVFKRGFSLRKDQKIIIVDDLLTTGLSIQEVIDLVKKYEAKIVGIGVMLDRSGGKVDFGVPLYSVGSVSADSWLPEECPLCKKGEPLIQRGSRILSLTKQY